MIRDYLNQFSDRWPDEYAHIYNTIPNQKQFQLTILWKYLKWAKPDREDAMVVWDLIQALENDGVVCTTSTTPSTPQESRVRYKVEIEDITDGKL